MHIHIADPTALIQPDDALGQRAERRFTTLYFPEARWAMLPDDFVRSGVGLRSSSSGEGANADGQRVMTFSALLDLSTGLVQETKTRPAVVHNVQTVSYSKVGVSSPSPATMATRAQRNFRCSSKWQRFSVRTGPDLPVWSHTVHVHRSASPLFRFPGVPVSASALDRPYFFAGFPTINVSGVSAGQGDAHESSNRNPALPNSWWLK